MTTLDNQETIDTVAKGCGFESNAGMALPNHDSTNPLRVCCFESRRAAEMRSLIERFGAIATVAPSMQEVPLENNADAVAFIGDLLDGRVDIVIFMTGVGAKILLEAAATTYSREQLTAAFATARVIIRGPKPAAVLREWNIRIDDRVPEPNTWRELLTTIDAGISVADKRVAVQEYGKPNEKLYAELRARAAEVVPVKTYRWTLPDDTEPLSRAIQSTIDGEFDLLLFTSAQQIDNLLQVAGSNELQNAWLLAAAGCTVGSIGPTCSDALREAGLPVHVEASPPKMAHLVRQTLDAAKARQS